MKMLSDMGSIPIISTMKEKEAIASFLFTSMQPGATYFVKTCYLRLVEQGATIDYNNHTNHINHTNQANTKGVTMSIVELKGVCKTYPAFRLNNVSFQLEEGQITGFIGRNGAGKTTTIKSMLNLVHADSGVITYFDMPLSDHEMEIKQRIGYSTGTVSWYPRKTIRQIIDVTKAFYPTWDEEAYGKYMMLFGLDENKKPIELSEGMKVKFNLLLALSHKAEILILDEPTSGLDPFSRDELLEIFETLKEHGVTILFSTHITSDIEKCADNIIYISNGEIRAGSAKADFIQKYGKAGESLEEIFLRLEREVRA